MKYYNNNSGYSIVISLLMVGFLIVVTSGVFNLVLGELNDNRGRENYLKAFAGAEGALELALLQVKENGYGYYGSKAVSNDNPILAEDISNIKKSKDAIVSYNLDSKTNSYQGTLGALGYAIVPLFILNDSETPEFLGDPVLSFAVEEDGVPLVNLVWNLLSQDGGISGIEGLNGASVGELRTLDAANNFQISSTSVRDFLNTRTNKLNYLILFNSDPSTELPYKISSSRAFTKPETIITSSAQVGKYKQNLATTLDNTEFLNILRYSIYSN